MRSENVESYSVYIVFLKYYKHVQVFQIKSNLSILLFHSIHNPWSKPISVKV